MRAKDETKNGLRPLNKKVRKSFRENFEFHHILPRSLYPFWAKKSENMVALTLREHYFCHKLLVKIYNNSKMFSALWYLANDGHHIVSSREYERLKILAKEKQSYSLNKKWYNNGKIRKLYIPGEEPKGFVLGSLSHGNSGSFKKGMSPNNKDKKCYTDGNVNIFIRENDIIPERFKLGRTYTRTAPSKKGLKCATKGMKHYTDGIHDVMAYKCPKGYVLGRPNKEKYATTAGFSWWNNGAEQKFCKECPDGWMKGRLIYGKNKINKKD